MKKTLLLLALLFPMAALFAQERDNVGHRVGPWNISNHNCFKGLSWKIRKSYYSDTSESYTNEIEIKNNYGTAITFSYNMSENANETTTRYKKTLSPGKTYTSTYCQNINMVNFYVAEVCFTGNCKSGCYALCDNGNPNQPDCGGNKISSANTTANQTTPSASTQSNTTQYKTNITTNTYANQSVINNNRQAAKAQQQTEAINELGQQTANLITAIQEDSKRRKEEKKIAAEKAVVEAEKKAEAAINTLKDPKVFESYCDFIVANMETLGFKFDTMSDYLVEATYKSIKINFSNDANVKISQRYSTSDPKMYNELDFRTTNSIYGNLLKDSDLFDFLKQLDYWDYEGHKNFYIGKNNDENTYRFTLFGLEKTQPFVNTYRNSYSSQNYNGASYYIKEIEEKVQKKLSNSQASTKELIDNGNMYREGKGVEKNYSKALEFYNKALEQGENEAMLSIAGVYSFDINDLSKAKEFLEKYLALGTGKNIWGARNILSYIYQNLGDFDKAISINKEDFPLAESDYKAAKTSKEKYNTGQKLYSISINIAQNYINKENATEGIKWYEEAATYSYYGAITLAQIYSYGRANQQSRAITTLLPKIKIKKSKKLAKEWANKACQSANNDILLYGDDPELKKSLEGYAKWCCTFVQDIVKD